MWSKIPAGLTVLVLAAVLMAGVAFAYRSLDAAPGGQAAPGRSAVAEIGRG